MRRYAFRVPNRAQMTATDSWLADRPNRVARPVGTLLSRRNRRRLCLKTRVRQAGTSHRRWPTHCPATGDPMSYDDQRVPVTNVREALRSASAFAASPHPSRRSLRSNATAFSTNRSSFPQTCGGNSPVLLPSNRLERGSADGASMRSLRSRSGDILRFCSTQSTPSRRHAAVKAGDLL